MGFLTTKELAERCGIATSTVRVNISRNKLKFVTVNDKKGKPQRMFDDSDLLNAEFLRRYDNLNATNPAKIADEKQTKTDRKRNDYAGTNNKLTPEQKKLVGTELRKKQLELQKLEHSVEIERMKKEKMQGEAIPTDLVTMLFSQHFKNLSLKYKEEAEKIASIMVKQLGGKNSDRIEIIKRLEDSINTAINEAKELSEMDLEEIIKQYSVKRGVGERM